MAMNKFMHPRNIYRTPPDFTKLAEEYAELKSITRTNPNGKVHIDFKDEQQLRTLTQCLLHRDFRLDVELPPLQLVPTLSLRLNYIHWIEDIMATFGIAAAVGIDIGCGASCIYPLLSARMNGTWRLYAAETNRHSFELARANIVRNQLADRIEAVHESCADDDPFAVIERGAGAAWPTLDFTMCNPPFFDENADADEPPHKNRTGHRQPANNIRTGIACELQTPGGEVAFVKRMVRQSDRLRRRVNVFTTMVGHKTSVGHIVDTLRASGIHNFCTSEFCQGRTTRWGIAWTWRNDLLLRTVPALGCTPPKGPIVFAPSDIEDIDLAAKKLKQVLATLVDGHADAGNRLDTQSAHCLRFCAFSNTWSKQRRRRREQTRHRSATESLEGDGEPTAKRAKHDAADDQQKAEPAEQLRTDHDGPPLVHVELVVRAHDATDFKTSVSVELTYLNGSAGVNGLHELLQFIRNQWAK